MPIGEQYVIQPCKIDSILISVSNYVALDCETLPVSSAPRLRREETAERRCSEEPGHTVCYPDCYRSGFIVILHGVPSISGLSFYPGSAALRSPSHHGCAARRTAGSLGEYAIFARSCTPAGATAGLSCSFSNVPVLELTSGLPHFWGYCSIFLPTSDQLKVFANLKCAEARDLWSRGQNERSSSIP
jgi:hypothetical protein